MAYDLDISAGPAPPKMAPLVSKAGKAGTVTSPANERAYFHGNNMPARHLDAAIQQGYYIRGVGLDGRTQRAIPVRMLHADEFDEADLQILAKTSDPRVFEVMPAHGPAHTPWSYSQDHQFAHLPPGTRFNDTHLKGVYTPLNEQQGEQAVNTKHDRSLYQQGFATSKSSVYAPQITARLVQVPVTAGQALHTAQTVKYDAERHDQLRK